jgi:tRNA pseudouridine55 synthase
MSRRHAAPGAPEGGLVIDKPQGLTSHDVVAVARRVLGQPRIGHTGTLDPLATGVLPLLLGRATRLAQFLSGATKTYEATVRFGMATTTCDATGAPIGSPSSDRPNRQQLDAALERFRGVFEQQPPAVSAKKVAGRRAYELARRDAPVALAPASVEIQRLEVVEFDGDTARLLLDCSAGFYVRALARDLGQVLGMGAHLAALRRTRSGDFGLDGSVSVDALVATGGADVRPMSALLSHLPAAILTDEGRARVARGQSPGPTEWSWRTLPPGANEGFVRLVDGVGELAAVARWTPELLRPVVVLL